ncbi:spermatogenesis-associated serine-rich protein 2 [Rhineura floridana]|uniref:spermatogenesis-associated serine-rich protein 2 n=1 Tax=Rhineura floridana TaxID=261503 RepID=UPI002AC848F4|nr:spermatogenesis-associated serine-rich protein 2 [Rhineura floridana]XP_061471391.1 spermatogenesis-associated serine-rich protein 2 [Rhineura floridana]XP_061471392.1 spermatogenesis-associated serine-rich protein 2 [Rhineura floridana]XP_061471393.1 spermatogenesis-associated serine-rich protein 2 [Rhineura floridana]XP_061471394.1 spermatogenesis-associated serine-rich protein 2 [Rhineura floridana]XP_061471395.1 spermatogenesis-associated serine-rich protein 2 [Rhineura floridana]
MSKKQNQKDSSGFIFDVQSNTVMAQGGTFENMKEKISAVRAIVPNRSNNEIILVLQHFDNCVDRTVQAFMEGSASAVLKEWTVTGKKKNKKKKTKPKAPAESSASLPDPSKPASTEEEQSAASSEKGGINGYHVNGSANDTESVDSLSEGLDTLSIDARESEESEPAMPVVPDRAASLENGVADLGPKPATLRSSQNTKPLRLQSELRNPGKPLSRPVSSSHSPAPSSLAMLDEVPLPSGNKKLGSNIEKSVKDLQRCTVSLARYRVVVKEEMDASIKKMKQAFAELQSCLMDREVALLGEMDKVKAEAMDILSSRQKKAEALKKMTDVAVRMSEEQLIELRADIKHFVSERKYDEDLGRVARFTCDLDALKRSIESFGQVSHPKNSYSTRSRCSSIIPMSVSSPDGSTTTTTVCASVSAPSLITANKKPPSPTEPPANAASRPYQPYREGNRRPSQGYRPQGQRQNGPSHPNSNRYRSGPWYQSNSRSWPPPGNTNSFSQTYSTGTNGTGSGPEPGLAAPSAQAYLGPLSKEAKALPQRKPRSSQYEVSSS